MASLTCPNCGRDNPDFLDNCQFCQTALRREATLNIGENPTKKSTGELEGVLPDWLRDARQQARDSAEEEAAKDATRPKIQKEEPPDLLAGLAFQAASDEEEVPDWLAAINPVPDKKSPVSAKDAPSDFFAQFEQRGSEPAAQITDDASLTGETQREESTDWFAQPSAPVGGEPFAFDPNAVDEPAAPAAPAEPEDLGWLRDLEASAKAPATPAQPSTPDWLSNIAPSSGEQEDLSWLNNLGGTPAPAQPAAQQSDDLSWLNNMGGLPLSNERAPEQPAPAEDDLSWLNNLGGIPAPSQPAPQSEDLDWLNKLGGTPVSPSPASLQPESLQEDLSWLNNLGDTPAPSQPAPQSEDLDWLNKLGGTPASSQAEPQPENLDWLNNLGGTPVPSEPASIKPETSSEDLSWLTNLGGTPVPAQPAEPAKEDLAWLTNLGTGPEPSKSAEYSQPAASQDDLDWLNNLGGTPETSQPAPAQEDLSWLNNLEAAPESAQPSSTRPEEPDWLKQEQPPTSRPLSPAHTAPLSKEAENSMPDWLKSAVEEQASMPPLGAPSKDWFAAHEKQPADELKSGFDERPGGLIGRQVADQAQPQPVSADHSLSTSQSGSTTISNKDVDDLFAVDMPDFSLPESATSEVSTAAGEMPANIDDSLAPVDLPSWVQAMRPVEAVISEPTATNADQPTEREGPLTGFRGVIPLAPIGSAQRPKAISLKLQATEEQQNSAALLEQIITGETTARPMKKVQLVAAQRALRWVLTGLFLIVLSAVIGAGTQMMPISADLPPEVNQAVSVITTMPDSALVLVVIDYEPSLAGEMEATAGPLLDQMTVLKRPAFTFVSTSPNGTGLVERLLANTKISSPTPYVNAGYLPGGSAGVQGFTEGPQTILPAVQVTSFQNFAAVILITDQAESGLVWIEQLTMAKQSNSGLANQPLLVVASAQAGPMLQPYVFSTQVAGMINGISEAARYEYANTSRPGIVRSYWDAFGVGLLMAILAMILGSTWSLIAGIRARRAEAAQG